MILILSQSSFEPTTEDVIDWIQALGGRWLRVNGDDLDGECDFSLEISMDNSVLHLHYQGTELQLAEVRAVWFRRWIHDRNRRHQQCNLLPLAPKLNYQVSLHLTKEARRLSDFFFQTFADRPWLSHPQTSAPNKLEVLRRAAIAGLEIPATLVTTRRAELERFCSLHDRVITKPIGDVAPMMDDGELLLMYTALVEPDARANLPATFASSLFQEYLQKDYELRVFYLDGEIYSMAIFSQHDPQTRVDFRHYNLRKPNRTVPYRLDQRIAESICSLMRDLQLETGSLDLIHTPDGRLVFLEVNPVGQFGMISKPCNYHLDRKLAEYLIAKAGDATRS